MSAKKERLTSEQRARIDRFMELSRQRGLRVELDGEETKVILKNRKGKVLGSRPVSDFADG